MSPIIVRKTTTINTQIHTGNTGANLTSVVEPEFVYCSVIFVDTEVSESCEKTTTINTEIIVNIPIPINNDCIDGKALPFLSIFLDLLTHNVISLRFLFINECSCCNIVTLNPRIPP